MLITSKDGQSASADWANFDVKANTALLGGDVVVMRGKDMAEGPRLKIDLTTGMYRFELEGDAAAAPGKQPAVAPTAPATPSSPVGAARHANLSAREAVHALLPKEAKDKAKDLLKKVP